MGVITCIEIMVVAAAIRSVSITIFGRLGTIEARIVIISTATDGLRISVGLSDGVDELSLSTGGVSSVNPRGFIVKVAESRREKRSCHNQQPDSKLF